MNIDKIQPRKESKNLFFSIILFECIVIICLLFIIRRRTVVTSGFSINPINPQTIIRNPTGGLSNFYEPNPQSIILEDYDWLSHTVQYTINKDALNERYDYPVAREKKVFRIITLGDSFTYGLHVNTADNWTELLEDELNKKYLCEGVDRYEIINLGMQGYDTEYAVERYRIRGLKYKPDIVIWYLRNLSRITNEIKEISKVLPTDNLKLASQKVIPGAWESAADKINEIYGEKKLFNFQIDKYNTFRKKYFKGPLFIFTRNKYVEDLKRISDSTTFVIGQSVDLDFNTKYQLTDSHYNESGNSQMENEILKGIFNNKLIPCTK